MDVLPGQPQDFTHTQRACKGKVHCNIELAVRAFVQGKTDHIRCPDIPFRILRKVWLPKTIAYILREWKKSQDELKGFLGDEYQDFDLVVALPNGRPCEDQIILKEFAKLREDAGLPKVVFHSLRHSSTTYKLKLNHGDLKANQGDTGHAEIDMITSIYAHILDEDRKVNAQKFETAFYAKPDLRNVRPPEEPVKSEPATLDLESLVEQLQKSPELASALAALIAAQAPAK